MNSFEINNEKTTINIFTNQKRNDSINLGIEILRAYMSFCVVVLHLYKRSPKNNNIFAKFIFHCQPFYVPTFFLISFYFSFIILSTKNIEKIKERFFRILIPYFFWPSFLWIRHLLYVYKKIEINFQTMKPIYNQLLFGYDFYTVFWFQFDLIMITIIIILIVFIFGNYSFLLLKLLAFFGYLINYNYEKSLAIYKKIGSIKPLIGSFIYSNTGLILRYNNILNKLNNKKWLILILFLPIITLLYSYKTLLNISIRFKIIVVDIVIIYFFIIFSLLPFKSIKSNIIKKIVKQLTSHTGGIYYIHFIMRNIMSKYFIIFNCGDIRSCIINYFFMIDNSLFYLILKYESLNIFLIIFNFSGIFLFNEYMSL